MAEARLAVHPMPGLQRAGFEVDTNVKVCQAFVGKQGLVVYIPHPRYWLRGVRRWAWKALNKTRVAFHPVPLWTIGVATAGVCGVVLRSEKSSWFRSGWVANALWRMDDLSPIARRLPVNLRVGYLAAEATVIGMGAFAAVQRFFLRRLLSYQGWLDRKNHKTLKTKVWGLLMTKLYLNRISEQLYAYQWCLPKLPLPSVKDTVAKYLTTVEPLMDATEMEAHKEMATKFIKEESWSLQWRLWLLWLVKRNYVSGWWLDFVYLRARDPLPINSNWYGITFADYSPTHSQAARAAVLTFNMVRLRTRLDNETMEPQILAGVAPLCMAQYSYAFSTTRVPGHEQDRLEKYDSHESRHVVVLHKGCIYKLPVFSPNTMQQLSPLQLLHAYEGILNSTDVASEAESLLPALTAGNRSEWAQLREEFFESDRHNSTRLEAIESAIFVVSLDDAEPKNFTEEGLVLMNGNGHNRWFDKSFNLVVTKNAKAGVNAEHSWGDAPALAHIMEMAMIDEKDREYYTDTGDVKHSAADDAKLKAGKFLTYPAMRIDFRTPKALLEHCRVFHADFKKRADDLELYVDGFLDFGKKFIGRNAKASPDAFIQMAMQLAYYRDQGHFDLTYESSMTRLFRDGRTETIRSVSNESCQFVLAFIADANNKEKKAQLQAQLRGACEQHQRYTMETMQGHGVDRHLFAMYVMSVGINKPSEFLKKALGRKWTLSTSQVPPRQCPDSMYKKTAQEFYCPNGGFGPVADNGYGVCYNVWDNRLYFNVSTKKSATNTSSERFHGRICQALRDMAALFQD
eukprot:CAMPEP_0174852294 /NCGR_PEP_ID=MMETSP1114-20130205/25285_1 /TAXON_ID=312471 /ORGANISM="Neobodo designis, Strain CCAP 1951/1" /LENGTH=796 /DNA_ID=CAMNT_0016086877 /DNA_START=138 /DNA_END=2528 /DNA_ORIENTATION=-